jgi:hypothetical protein
MKSEKALRKMLKAMKYLRSQACDNPGKNGQPCLICMARIEEQNMQISLLETVLEENLEGEVQWDRVLTMAERTAAPSN